MQDVLHATSHQLAACSSHSRPNALNNTSRVTPSDPHSPSPNFLQPQPCSSPLQRSARPVNSTSVRHLDREAVSLSARQDAVCCDMIIVHGAGSFGHHQAHSHGVSRGPLTDPHVRAGFAATRYGPSSLQYMESSNLHQMIQSEHIGELQSYILQETTTSHFWSMLGASVISSSEDELGGACITGSEIFCIPPPLRKVHINETILLGTSLATSCYFELPLLWTACILDHHPS